MRKKNFIFLTILLLPVIFIAGCSFGNSKEKSTDWRNEILLAQACGEDGLQCCLDQDPACKYGTCCVDPNNPDKNYCSESCDFGKVDTFCRAGKSCDDALACRDSYCIACGGVDQPCCQNEACEGDLACFRGDCVECGVTGNPCCASEPVCLDEEVNNPQRSECASEICSLCGADGNVPCALEPRCNDDHLLNNNACYGCGSNNQPCCQNVTFEGTEKYCVEAGLTCTLDFCSK